MQSETDEFGHLDFIDLEDKFGSESARAILLTLERFEGISEYNVAKLSYAERLHNVMTVMKENIRYQTRH